MNLHPKDREEIESLRVGLVPGGAAVEREDVRSDLPVPATSLFPERWVMNPVTGDVIQVARDPDGRFVLPRGYFPVSRHVAEAQLEGQRVLATLVAKRAKLRRPRGAGYDELDALLVEMREALAEAAEASS